MATVPNNNFHLQEYVCNTTRWFIPAFSLQTAVLFSPQSLCLTHTGKPTDVAVSHCIT